jgi:CRP-like cAMP-binding protein
MSKKPDQFDLDGFRLDSNDVESMNRAYHDARAKAAARQKRGDRSTTTKRRAAVKGAYVQMRTEDAVAGFHSLRCPQALVWHHLQYRAWATGSATVTLANKALAVMGVSRFTKYRALQRLEEDGLIKVKRRERRSPIITILNWTPPTRSRPNK